MVYIDGNRENKQATDMIKYLDDIRGELQNFRQIVVGIGTVLIIVQILLAVLK
jgi:hypothetical protein